MYLHRPCTQHWTSLLYPSSSACPVRPCIQAAIDTSTCPERYSAQVGIPRDMQVTPSGCTLLSLSLSLSSAFAFSTATTGRLSGLTHSQVQDGMSRLLLLFGAGAAAVLLCWLQKWILGLCFASVAPLALVPLSLPRTLSVPLGR